ncbi:MAG: multidrug efflux pump subunit AcrB [Gammaproteobacteria bacterium]|jgi:multidrug efflux pump subunit AcrB
MFHFAVHKPVILTVAILIICVFGINAVNRLPKQMIPDLDARVISVRTTWPGATPQDIEKEIIIEQEDYLRSIPNLDRMISNASTGQARIELEFPYGVDLNEVLIRVNNALSQVPEYPENVDEPRIVTTSTSDNPFMFFRITPQDGNPKNVTVGLLQDYIRDFVGTRLERIPGVAEVEVWGGTDRQIKIYVDPARLAEREISLLELRDAIRGRNRDVSGGDLDAGKRRYIVRTLGRFESVQDIDNLIIARRDGIPVRLKEVGYAGLGSFEVRTVSYANGVPNVTLGVRRMIGANVVKVMDEVMASVEELNAGALAAKGLRMNLSSEDVQYVKDAVSIVVQNLLIGAALSIVVLYLFLSSSRATLIGAMGIPICTIVAFFGLMLAGRTINVISLAGVAFAIGMTLDNSIVVLENIYRHLGEGKDRLSAAVDGVTEVWPAILASTLTTVLVFLPVVFVTEEAGQLYSDIAIAIGASILMSMAVAVTLVPAAAGRYLSAPVASTSRLHLAADRSATATINMVAWAIDNTARRIMLIVFVFMLSASIILFLTPKAEYLPEGEEQKIFAFMFSPPGYNIASMDTIIQELNDYLVPFIGADPSDFERGEAEVPALNYMFGYARAGSILLIPEATSRAQVDDLVKSVSRRFKEVPGVIAFASRGSIFASNTGGSRSINLDISGPDLVRLFDVGLKAFIRSKEIFDKPQVRPQPSSLTMGQPLLEIRPDWERATELGLDTTELGYAIWAFTDGAFVDEFFLGDDKIDMFLYSTNGVVERPADIGHLLLYTQNGGVVPLNAISTITETVNTETIRRVDGQRTITLSIIPPRDIPLEAGVERVQKMLIDELQVADDSGITMRISGANDSLKATRAALNDNFSIAILIAYLLLVAIFSHWGYPLIIMLTVPVGISGGVVGLWLLNFFGARLDTIGIANIHQPLDVITMLGFLILIGTVVNNPILIVEKALANVRQGLSVKSAVIESTRARLRPIVMSTVTTVFGLSPLVVNPGAGTELYRGLGAIVLFGLLFSSVITLTFMPALLSLVLESKLRWFGANEIKRESLDSTET